MRNCNESMAGKVSGKGEVGGKSSNEVQRKAHFNDNILA